MNSGARNLFPAPSSYLVWLFSTHIPCIRETGTRSQPPHLPGNQAFCRILFDEALAELPQNARFCRVCLTRNPAKWLILQDFPWWRAARNPAKCVIFQDFSWWGACRSPAKRLILSDFHDDDRAEVFQNAWFCRILYDEELAEILCKIIKNHCKFITKFGTYVRKFQKNDFVKMPKPQHHVWRIP